jgi:two-component system cell cycle response regulator
MNKKEKGKNKKDDKDPAISNASELLSVIAEGSAANGAKEGASASRILVIDDDEDVRILLRDLLEESLYAVDTASCGEEALKMIRVSTYDMVVTDLRMAGMHGLEVIKEVKAIDPGIDVIVMTGYASVNSAVESMKAGAIDYITKPFNSDQIRLVVKKNIERRNFQRLASEREFYKILSSIDGLTELYNYRYFHQHLTMEIERERRYSRPLSLIMLDIDDFKEYNDRYGHPVGDLVLKNLAAILKSATRGCDVICRYGGEEFAIVLPETDKKEAANVCERMRQAVEDATMCDGEGTPIGNISITVGLASFPADAEDKAQLIEKADKALYQGKRTGKNCTFLYGAKGKNKKVKKKTE